MKSPQQILNESIAKWEPVHVVCLFSGGYDSMCMTHLAHTLDTHGVPMSVWAVDTNLAADGWHDYLRGVADELSFRDFNIYDNKKGYAQYVEWVREHGCPRNITGHTRAFARLKERGIDAIHMMYKDRRSDKTLFLSGMRKYESAKREKEMQSEVQRRGTSNKVFANPLFWWTDEDIARYRIEHDLPDNPFYDTVKGSGDCQCNWGNFISLGTLQLHSPILAAGNVADINRISLDNHGYGWDGQLDIESLFDMNGLVGDGELTTPFLCSNCSRQGKPRHKAIEEVMLQRGLF